MWCYHVTGLWSLFVHCHDPNFGASQILGRDSLVTFTKHKSNNVMKAIGIYLLSSIFQLKIPNSILRNKLSQYHKNSMSHTLKFKNNN